VGDIAVGAKNAGAGGKVYIFYGPISGSLVASSDAGAIISNSGHFNVEIDIPALERMAVEKRRIRGVIDEYRLKDGRRLYLLAEGRLVNLSSAEGHPASVMDMSFANQALSAEYMVKEGNKLKPGVYNVPPHIDKSVASLKLKAMGITIDELTQEQSRYLSSWNMGT
jgi:adenosylhomocysteinase